MAKNQLYYGDNLDVLRRHVAAESVDLVYLDPPFNSQQDYNVLFQERTGSKSVTLTLEPEPSMLVSEREAASHVD